MEDLIEAEEKERKERANELRKMPNEVLQEMLEGDISFLTPEDVDRLVNNRELREYQDKLREQGKDAK